MLTMLSMIHSFVCGGDMDPKARADNAELLNGLCDLLAQCKSEADLVARIRLRPNGGLAPRAGFGGQVPDRVLHARWRHAGPAAPDIAPLKGGAHPGYAPKVDSYGGSGL